jgi:hypothetical protein
MSDRSASFLGGLKNPEYTGENRCVPCTVVNALIAVAVSGLVALAVPLLGLVVLAASALLIYFRGYLVPGTPELTKRYLPARVLTAFGKNPVAERRATEFVDGEENDDSDGVAAGVGDDADSGASGDAGESEAFGDDGESKASDDADSEASDDAGDSEASDDADSEEPTFETVKKIQRRREQSVDPVSFLREADVLAPGDDDDPQLTAAFADRARERTVAYRDGEVETAVIRDIFGADPDDVAERDREYPAYEIGVRIRKWPSEGALIADAATHEVLGEYAEGWSEVPPEQRADVLEWLRGLRDACPVCDGEITFSDDVIESCCGQFEVTTIACTDCGERLREFDPVKVGNREDLKGITP